MRKTASHSTCPQDRIPPACKAATSPVSWRDYLVTQMQAQFGLARQEAHKVTDRWLRSVNVIQAARASQRVAPKRTASQVAATS